MNWYKYSTLQQDYQNVQSALMALKYTKPEIDPLNGDFSQLVNALVEIKKVPNGMNPERFAAQIIFFLNQNGEVDEL